MDVFIYSYERLKAGLDELEDALDAGLLGFGEVTGSGIGVGGSNLDIDIYEPLSDEEILRLLMSALATFDIPSSTVIRISDRKYVPFSADWGVS